MPALVRLLGATAMLLSVAPARPTLQTATPNRTLVLTATDPADLRAADALVDRMIRVGDLRVVAAVDDTLVPGRRHERYAQYHDGVRVFGADVTRQTASGLTVSIFGQVHLGLTLGTEPTIAADAVPGQVASRFGFTPIAGAGPERLIMRDDTGTFRLVHRLTAGAADGPHICFVDAHTGAMVRDHRAIRSNNDGLPCDNCRVGAGRGVKGDSKKISVRAMDAGFRAIDLLRPPMITTYDMDGDWERLLDILNGVDQFRASDVARDPDNTWNDGAVVDGHVGAGWTYDYLYTRFGRRGLDGRDGPIESVVHPVDRAAFRTVPDHIFSLFHLNAFWCGACGSNGVIVYGEGLPAGHILRSTGQRVDFFSASLEVVAHELIHGVTAHTSNLIYENESGALNEAFSDILGVSVQFFMADSGRHPEQADYRIGEDIFTPNGVRSLADPTAFNHPDHYSRRFLGTFDNGGVHDNSLIAGHAFYLAIEGGTNRTSGLPVTGVGSRNRAQVEQVFYRAFTLLMPADATFSVARGTTLQSARDMFGAGHAVERAIRDAWTAVGVE